MKLSESISKFFCTLRHKLICIFKVMKIKSRINEEQMIIEDAKRKIGEIHYTRYQANEGQLPEVQKVCQLIDFHHQAIKLMQEEIKNIKADEMKN